MTIPFEPVIGEWYKVPEGEVFEVVAINEHDGTVDVQYADGTVGEFDAETWAMLEAVTTVAPPDAAGEYSDIGNDDLHGIEELDGIREDWAQNSFDDFD